MHKVYCKVTTSDRKTYYNVKLTNKSPNTVSRMLSALKTFYKIMVHVKMYIYPNPLIDAHAILDEYETQIEGVRGNLECLKRQVQKHLYLKELED